MFEYGKGIRNPLFFVGVIEENVDPRKEGRVKVRAFGVHGLNTDIPRDELPWAICVKGDYDPNGSPGLGLPALNSFVFGMFLDGESAQQPMVLGLIPTQYTQVIDPEANGWGTIPRSNAELLMRGSAPEDYGQPQNSRRSRAEYMHETSTADQNANRVEEVEIAGSERTWTEPPPGAQTSYPFNRVIESGAHVIELDDTPDAERILIYHKEGSYMQIDARGVVINKAVSDQYDIMDRNEHKVVGGQGGGFSTVTINGNSYVKVKGNKTEEIDGDLQTLVHGNHLLSVGGQSTLVAGEQAQIRAADVKLEANVSSLIIKAGKEIQFQSGEGLYVKSDKVYVQAMEELHLKADLTYMEGTTELDIFSERIFMSGTEGVDVTGESVLRMASNGDIHVNTPATIQMDTFVNMANGDSEAGNTSYPAEASKDASAIEAPEPVTKSTAINPEDPVSIGGGGQTAGDDVPPDTDASSSGVQTSAATQTSLTPLLDLINSVESSVYGYESVSGQIPDNLKPSKPITTMKISEILAYQERIDKDSDSEALGRYQIVEDTLRGYDNQDPSKGKERPLYERAGLSVNDLFSPENQDKLAIALINKRGLQGYLAGTTNINVFANNLAKEWAGLPLVSGPNAGKSHYDGDGLNSAKPDNVQKFLNILRQLTSSETNTSAGGAR